MPPKQHRVFGSPPRSPAEKAREALNAATVKLVAEGFDAIDKMAEIAKNQLKRAIIRAISPPRKK